MGVVLADVYAWIEGQIDNQFQISSECDQAFMTDIILGKLSGGIC